MAEEEERPAAGNEDAEGDHAEVMPAEGESHDQQ